MLNEESVSRKNVTGFLLGLGIGLVVGIVFQPQTEDSLPQLKAGEPGKPAPRKLRSERSVGVGQS